MNSLESAAFACGSETETDQLAAALAPHLQPGDAIALDGGLGAGKTRFVQGVARALGIDAEVTSPTFTIHAVYPGPLEVNHFDLYRLEGEEDLDDIGYWDAVEGAGVSFVEWAHSIPASMPGDHLSIAIESDDSGTRTFDVRAHGPRSRQLLGAWAQGAPTLT